MSHKFQIYSPKQKAALAALPANLLITSRAAGV